MEQEQTLVGSCGGNVCVHAQYSQLRLDSLQQEEKPSSTAFTNIMPGQILRSTRSTRQISPSSSPFSLPFPRTLDQEASEPL